MNLHEPENVPKTKETKFWYPSNKTAWKPTTIYDSDFRPELIMMAQTIDNLKLWTWLETFNPSNGSFMFDPHENINAISSKLPVNNHSGATFAYAMRIMQCIAQKGFEYWNNLNTPD
jgi:hypothetical protein